jgi:hypothetical protein
MSWVDDKDALIVGRSLYNPALRRQRNAEVVVGVHTTRLEGKGGFVSCHGRLDFALRCESDAQIVVNIGIIGLEEEDTMVSRHGVFEMSGHMMPHRVGKDPLDVR